MSLEFIRWIGQGSVSLEPDLKGWDSPIFVDYVAHIYYLYKYFSMYRNKSGFHGGREAGGCKASPLLELSSSVLSQSESSELGGPCEE